MCIYFEYSTRVIYIIERDRDRAASRGCNTITAVVE